MAVNEHGEWVGRISSGCAEAAIATEAVRAIRENRTLMERYGVDSKYLDITLPCGSGLDIYFDPMLPTRTIDDLWQCVRARQPVGLTFKTDSPSSSHYELSPLDVQGPQDEEVLIRRQNAVQHTFTKMYFPTIRIDLAGRGPILLALARMASILGWDIRASSPEKDTLSALEALSAGRIHLTSPGAFDVTGFDRWTAAVLLFHEHEWEPQILSKVLQAGGFYVGALGSRRAHKERCRALLDLGCKGQLIDSIRGPVGLDIGSRTSEEIALAITSEILAAARCPAHLSTDHV